MLVIDAIVQSPIKQKKKGRPTNALRSNLPYVAYLQMND